MKAVKYEKIKELPSNAIKVSLYADKIGVQPAYISVMYDRYLGGKGAYPGYKIANWQGFNFVIPD